MLSYIITVSRHDSRTVVKHPVLQRLEKDLPGVMRNARATNTLKVYDAAWQRWIKWATPFHEVCVCPADPYMIALYMLKVGAATQSVSMILHTVQAIAWGHSMRGFESPTLSVWVREVVNGLKRKYSQVRKSKEPLSLNKLIEIMSLCNKKSLTDLRNTCCMVLGFFVFLRCEEILGIKRNHMVFHDTHLEIVLPNSKTDKLRQGNRVLIAKLHDSHCPVTFVNLYLASTKIKDTEQKFIFRRIVTANSHQFLTLLDEPMKYGNLRDILARKFEQVNLNPKLYGMHSLRAGGCSAVANKGIADRLFQKHGRWASSASKDGYVTDSISKLLLVTKSLKK